jgi:hypothetical protein
MLMMMMMMMMMMMLMMMMVYSARLSLEGTSTIYMDGLDSSSSAMVS